LPYLNTDHSSTYSLHPSKLFATPHFVLFLFVLSMLLAWSLSLVIRTVTHLFENEFPIAVLCERIIG